MAIESVLSADELVLVTGSNGLIGSKVIENLLRLGFSNIRAFVRPCSNVERLERIQHPMKDEKVHLFAGNLLSKEDCHEAMANVSVVFHCAAGMACKTFSEMFLNTVVTTRNLLDAAVADKQLKRLLNVSSFAVYSNMSMKRRSLLDERCEIENKHRERYDPYSFAKVKQEEILWDYSKRYALPIVIVRPGAVYGPGAEAITSRVGISTFGPFLHIGGSNQIPFSFIDNCADAIILAGIKKNIEGQVLNIVDDDPPKSREFLIMYKREVGMDRSFNVPYVIFYFLSYLWEKYSRLSKGQLPPVFNRRKTAATWKGNVYSNRKLKEVLGWEQRISTPEALSRHFSYLREKRGKHA